MAGRLRHGEIHQIIASCLKAEVEVSVPKALREGEKDRATERERESFLCFLLGAGLGEPHAMRAPWCIVAAACLGMGRGTGGFGTLTWLSSAPAPGPASPPPQGATEEPAEDDEDEEEPSWWEVPLETATCFWQDPRGFLRSTLA